MLIFNIDILRFIEIDGMRNIEVIEVIVSKVLDKILIFFIFSLRKFLKVLIVFVIVIIFGYILIIIMNGNIVKF